MSIWFRSSVSLVLTLGISQSLQSSPFEPGRAKDIAIILPAHGEDGLSMDQALLPSPWWNDLRAAYAQTSVGPALDVENQRSDWRLVAMRFAPCQPLLPYISPRNHTLCQPELRLIWQPVQQQWRQGRWLAYADDRAIHALYRIDGEAALGPEASKVWRGLAQRAASLSAAEELQYAALNAAVAAELLSQLKGLRGEGPVARYDGIGERPECADPAQAGKFLVKLRRFLGQHAKPQLLTQLTTFSLPEGRNPPLIDEWVFLAFVPAQQGQRLQPQALSVRSRHDGRLLAEYGFAARASVRRDEAVLQGKLDAAGDGVRDELQDAVIWTFAERASKGARIADPEQTHVAHTSCVSCHKLGDTGFNLHNLSYLEEGDIAVSPRVEKDVARELLWLNAGVHGQADQ